MTKIIMHGCNGRMGQNITKIVEADANAEIVAGIDVFDGIKNTYPVFKSLAECDVEADVIIDFSLPSSLDALLDYCVDKQVPVVLCTTGLSPEQLEQVKEASGKVAVLKSANMSMGINLLQKLLKDAAPLLAEAGFDIEIVEKHHKMKKDAPSGTALALGDSINEALTEKYDYVYDRSNRSMERPKNEIGYSVVRGGTIVGDHDVIFAGEDEVITLSHRAYSRAVFGKGAVQAAKFLAGKPAGMYDMGDVINA
nr:4-hydroxy-tetrahydrodipicolinate reductase [Lachnospiraceae bacterium]